MKKAIYHGSEKIIANPVFGQGARHNDYGRGFYCTENLELAKEWACAKNTNGFCKCYELEMEHLTNASKNSPIPCRWLR